MAIGLHQRNHLDEAESIYRKILEQVPDNVDALHFLGVIHHQRHEDETAQHDSRSVAADPHRGAGERHRDRWSA